LLVGQSGLAGRTVEAALGIKAAGEAQGQKAFGEELRPFESQVRSGIHRALDTAVTKLWRETIAWIPVILEQWEGSCLARGWHG
jgi:hypothetical protein